MGQALTSWLRSNTQLGVLLGGRRSVSGQYTDTKAFLSDCHPATVAILTDALQRFADASGQHTHLGKSRALFAGSGPAAPCPAALAGGIPVVQHVDILGASAAAAPPPLPGPLPPAHDTRASHMLPLTGP
eukprot:366397-Chlamydomonas_euryale.AAC.1